MTCPRCGVIRSRSGLIYNLVENATKYAPSETEIRIEVRRESAGVRVEVLDRGPGLPSSAVAHLFEPFYGVL